MYGVREVLRAAGAGDANSIRALLAGDRNLRRAEHGSVKPLHLAVRGGHEEAVKVLLQFGGDPAEVVDGDALAVHARDRGHESTALLLETETAARRAVPPAEGEEHAVHEAASRGDAATIRSLLSSNPDLVDLPDPAGGTPLHRAVAASKIDIARMLLDRGADIHALHGAGRGSARGYAAAGFQPIDLALWTGPYWNLRGDFLTARLLVGRGADCDIVIAAAFGDEERVRDILRRDPAAVRHARPSGKRALPAAIEFQRPLARFLVECGADPNWPDGPAAPRGSALHAAARAGDEPAVRLLLRIGADPNAEIDSSGSAVFVAATPAIRSLLLCSGGTLSPYDLAWLGEDGAVMDLIERDPGSADLGCGGVLAAACRLGNRDLLLRLLDAGVRVPSSLTGCSSYLWERPALLQLLLENGMDPNLPDVQRATPLHDLCNRDGRQRPRPLRETCARLLLEYGADINAVDDTYRSTPLGWAARRGLPDMAELLLGLGAKVDHAPDWASPLVWAVRRGHAGIADRLRRAGATFPTGRT